jgi:tyrosinase
MVAVMADEVVEHPTYFEHIRHFFDPVDIEHMAQLGIDLSTYDALKVRATSVYFRTEPPNATMPPDAERRWSAERSQTFGNWIRDGFVLGQPVAPDPLPVEPVDGSTAKRVRKDARELSADEISVLSHAFSEVMARDPDDPEGYFVLAGLHWFPAPSECLHHEDRYNPWHRVYMTRFEDALRTVPGCEAVTLPYWNIAESPPDFLFAAPFHSYTLPLDVHPNYPAGYSTTRFDPDQITANVANEDIAGIIDDALAEPIWRDFISSESRGIEAAHDVGHPSIGLTMSTPDVAAFDPIFWFFHSNWDRLWWRWQQVMSATTLPTFSTTIVGSSTAFLSPPFNELRPFDMTAEQTIDLAAMGVEYAEPLTIEPPSRAVIRRSRVGSLAADQNAQVVSAPQTSVRLKGIDRLAIPGSFRAILRADGEVVGRRTFFQSTEPVDCGNCREHAKVNLDFIVDVDRLLGRTLSATIEPILTRPDVPAVIPLAACGNPTLNARLLIERT